MTIADTCLTYLISHAPVLMITLFEDGVILGTNDYADQTLGGHIKNKQIETLIVDFQSSFNLAALVATPDTKHLLTLQTSTELPKSVHVQFIPKNKQVIAFGHLDIMDSELMND